MVLEKMKERKCVREREREREREKEEKAKGITY